MKYLLFCIWMWIRFGKVTSNVKDSIGSTVCEVEYRGRRNKIVGYWAYGNFEPEGYRGNCPGDYPAFEELIRWIVGAYWAMWLTAFSVGLGLGIAADSVFSIVTAATFLWLVLNDMKVKIEL